MLVILTMCHRGLAVGTQSEKHPIDFLKRNVSALRIGEISHPLLGSLEVATQGLEKGGAICEKGIDLGDRRGTLEVVGHKAAEVLLNAVVENLGLTVSLGMVRRTHCEGSPL